LREFVAFLQKLNKAYAPSTAIKLILDNHSAHLQGNPAWLATQPEGRFAFVFTPNRAPRSISSKASSQSTDPLPYAKSASHPTDELKQRIVAAIDPLTRDPVLHAWTYELAEASTMSRLSEAGCYYSEQRWSGTRRSSAN